MSPKRIFIGILQTKKSLFAKLYLKRISYSTIGYMAQIKKVFARQVLDSRGYPTVEAEVTTQDGVFGAIVPSGTSAGKHEALELRDGGKEFFGKGVKKAVENANTKIAKKILGMDTENLGEIDRAMIELDGTPNKSSIGANAILAVSMACCRAGAAAQKKQLFEFISKMSDTKKMSLPNPMMVVVSGGAHADKSTDLQEFMIMPTGAKSFLQAMKFGVETYHALEILLKKKGMHTNVGKEGSFAPTIPSNEEALDLIISAIEEAGYAPGKDISITIDAAASEFFENGKYFFKTENKTLSAQQLIEYYEGLLKNYPIISLEDPFAEDDWQAFSEFTKRNGTKLQIIGDDLLATNPVRIKKAIRQNSCNALLLKVNQIGTVTEALKAAKLSFENNWNVIVSHRSGDTEDAFIADLAVGIGCGQIKTGAPARSERTAKYNQLLRIEEKIGNKAAFNGKNFLKKSNS